MFGFFLIRILDWGLKKEKYSKVINWQRIIEISLVNILREIYSELPDYLIILNFVFYMHFHFYFPRIEKFSLFVPLKSGFVSEYLIFEYHIDPISLVLRQDFIFRGLIPFVSIHEPQKNFLRPQNFLETYELWPYLVCKVLIVAFPFLLQVLWYLPFDWYLKVQCEDLLPRKLYGILLSCLIHIWG